MPFGNSRRVRGQPVQATPRHAPPGISTPAFALRAPADRPAPASARPRGAPQPGCVQRHSTGRPRPASPRDTRRRMAPLRGYIAGPRSDAAPETRRAHSQGVDLWLALGFLLSNTFVRAETTRDAAPRESRDRDVTARGSVPTGRSRGTRDAAPVSRREAGSRSPWGCPGEIAGMPRTLWAIRSRRRPVRRSA
jgi:hypothetical protein